MATIPQSSTWTRVLAEILALDPPNPDIVRRSKLAAVHTITGRPLVAYATACTIPNKIVPNQVLMLDFSDKLAFENVTERIEGNAIDIIIHSPGGIAEAVESLVSQLRGRFTDIRFIIPNLAKSAATMLAMSGNEILMGHNAELGPIDPQMNTIFGTHPAESIIEQFEQASAEILDDSRKVTIWGPILANLAPSLLVECRHAIELSKKLVTGWLRTYMFANDPEAETKSNDVVRFLANHAYFQSHARRVTLRDMQERGVKVTDLTLEPTLASAVQEAYCAIDITFSNTMAVRLIENHLGDAIVRSFSQGPVLIPGRPPAPRPAP